MLAYLAAALAPTTMGLALPGAFDSRLAHCHAIDKAEPEYSINLAIPGSDQKTFQTRKKLLDECCRAVPMCWSYILYGFDQPPLYAEVDSWAWQFEETASPLNKKRIKVYQNHKLQYDITTCVQVSNPTSEHPSHIRNVETPISLLAFPTSRPFKGTTVDEDYINRIKSPIHHKLGSTPSRTGSTSGGRHVSHK